MNQEEKLTTAAQLLRDSQNVVVFTGAGASAESGILRNRIRQDRVLDVLRIVPTPNI